MVAAASVRPYDSSIRAQRLARPVGNAPLRRDLRCRNPLPQVIGFIVELVLLAVSFAWIADRVLRLRYPPRAVIRNNPTWFEMINGQVRPEGTKTVIVSAELKNGASIQGAVKAHEPGKDQALAWLVLQPHSAIKLGIRNPDGTFVDVPPGWAYTVIAGDDIRSANIAYVKSET
jgi:hypothetical protein